MKRKFASPIVALRRQGDWSQTALAKLSGVPLPTLRRIETGLCRPRTRTALRLAAALGCAVDDLFRSHTMRRGVPGARPR